MCKWLVMKENMFFGAGPLIFENAKRLRGIQTDAEMVLWGCLKQHFSSLRFRRQHPISIYIADFYCHKLKLVIEVDGLIHEQPAVKETDFDRQKYLERLGLKVLRFTNNEVMTNIEKVIKTNEAFVTSNKNNSSPFRGARE
jgi:imidazole glycerol-phosphate synthase subunit HisF